MLLKIKTALIGEFIEYATEDLDLKESKAFSLISVGIRQLNDKENLAFFEEKYQAVAV